MDIKNVFVTRHLGLSAVLSYVGKRHLSTFTEPGGRVSFEFEDESDPRCADIAVHFFSKNGMATSDARDLLECLRAVKQTMSYAIRAEDGRWDVKP